MKRLLAIAMLMFGVWVSAVAPAAAGPYGYYGYRPYAYRAPYRAFYGPRPYAYPYRPFVPRVGVSVGIGAPYAPYYYGYPGYTYGYPGYYGYGW